MIVTRGSSLVKVKGLLTLIVLMAWPVTARAQDSTSAATPDTSATAVPATANAPLTLAEDAWSPGRQWLSLRFGAAKSGVEGAADGNLGAGFGLTAMGKGMWSVGAFAHIELLGRFGSASEIEIPLTVEFARHAAWKSVVRPYLGLGGGAFFHKTYRTGADAADMRPGFYLLGGMNTPISSASLLGFDVRVIFQGAAGSEDPVFPNRTEDATHWSVKVNYARVN